MSFRELRVNGQIEAPEVRLIDERNQHLGVLSLGTALRIAREKALDLVEVVPQAAPAVCRLMDYGEYRRATIEREGSPDLP